MTLQPLLPAVLGAIVLARTKLLPEPVSVLIPIGAALICVVVLLVDF